MALFRGGEARRSLRCHADDEQFSPRSRRTRPEGTGEPHDPRAPGLAAVLRYVHAAGPQARLTLEQIQNRETVEVEISRSELAALGLKVGDLATLRLRQARSFDADYAI